MNILLRDVKKVDELKKIGQKNFGILLTNRNSCAKIGGCAKKWRFLMHNFDWKGNGMEPSILIAAATCLAMIAAVLFFPKVNIGRLSLGSYWVVTVVGAILLLLVGAVEGSVRL